MYVVIIILNDVAAAYGPFDTASLAGQWLKLAQERHVIGSTMTSIVSRVYEPKLP